MTELLASIAACPRCDKGLEADADVFRCDACDVAYPLVGDIPWLFSEPDASLADWRNRLQMALQTIGRDVEGIDKELKDEDLGSLAKRRLERYREALRQHAIKLKKLVRPLLDREPVGKLESFLAMRTRLPSDQGLNTYYANIHRDWCWGDEENESSLRQIASVVNENAELGRVLVLGCGAGRLAYDIAMQMDSQQVVAMDFNPMLMFVAQKMLAGDKLKMYEFPIAPASLEDDAVLRTLKAPEATDKVLLVLGDALRPPFAIESFDTIVTPWLIDIISEDLGVFAKRINRLVKKDGRWLNFGSLAFTSPKYARRYSPEEVKTIVSESGFSDPYTTQSRIPYMCSPASRHGRQEKVFTFQARKEKTVKAPERHRALPDWIVTGKEPVPLTQSFRTQSMTTQIYAFIMSLIDGRRSINDMAIVLEKQQLMSRDEAAAAIRNFLTKMYDDSQRSQGY